MKSKMPNSKEFAEYDYLQSASAQDCTGLIPIAPTTEEEQENFEQLYPILPGLALKNDIDYVED